jgi:hypothetical protein
VLTRRIEKLERRKEKRKKKLISITIAADLKSVSPETSNADSNLARKMGEWGGGAINWMSTRKEPWGQLTDSRPATVRHQKQKGSTFRIAGTLLAHELPETSTLLPPWIHQTFETAAAEKENLLPHYTTYGAVAPLYRLTWLGQASAGFGPEGMVRSPGHREEP